GLARAGSTGIGGPRRHRPLCARAPRLEQGRIEARGRPARRSLCRAVGSELRGRAAGFGSAVARTGGVTRAVDLARTTTVAGVGTVTGSPGTAGDADREGASWKAAGDARERRRARAGG